MAQVIGPVDIGFRGIDIGKTLQANSNPAAKQDASGPGSGNLMHIIAFPIKNRGQYRKETHKSGFDNNQADNEDRS